MRQKSPEQVTQDAEAVQLKASGKTFRQIAAIQGVSLSTAYHRVGRAMAAIPSEAVAQVRAMELERLDEMHAVAWDQLHMDHLKVDHGHVVHLKEVHVGADGTPIEIEVPIIDHGPKLAALDRLLRIQERRAKLLGLDAPNRVNISVISEEVIDAELEQRRQRRLELLPPAHTGTD